MFHALRLTIPQKWGTLVSVVQRCADTSPESQIRRLRIPDGRPTGRGSFRRRLNVVLFGKNSE